MKAPLPQRILLVVVMCATTATPLPAGASSRVLPTPMSSADVGLSDGAREPGSAGQLDCGPESQIAFTSWRDGNQEIYLACADGSGLLRLTRNMYEDKFPLWSPDGDRLAFTSYRYRNDEIFVADLKTGTVTNVSKSAADDFDPAWSPDGSALAFVSRRDGNDQVYVVAPDGSGLRNLSSSDIDEFSPSWSPDGDHIVFAAYGEGTSDIWVMKADGSEKLQLTRAASDNTHPAWSPAGDLIAFVSRRDRNDEIYLMSADGSNQVNVTNGPADEVLPVWSPDGASIAFVTEQEYTYEVGVLNVSARKWELVTDNDWDDMYPSWSPDSRRIAIVSRANMDDDVAVVDVRTHAGTWLTQATTTDGSVAWRPAGIGTSSPVVAIHEPTHSESAATLAGDSPGWATVPGSRDLLMGTLHELPGGVAQPYWPGSPVQITDTDSLSPLSIESSGDFGVGITVPADGLNYDAITLREEGAWTMGWQNAKFITLYMGTDALAVEVMDRTNPIGHSYRFPLGEMSWPMQVLLRRAGSEFIVLANGRELGRFPGPGDFPRGKWFVGVGADHIPPFTVLDMWLETPVGSPENVRMNDPRAVRLDSAGALRTQPTLRALADPQHFWIGSTAMDGGPKDYFALTDPELRTLLAQEFNYASIGGYFQQWFSRGRGDYDFRLGDASLVVIRTMGLQAEARSGITWGETAPWLDNAGYTKEELEEVLRDLVRTLLRHYRGQVMVWSAINEMTTGHPIFPGIWISTLGVSVTDKIQRWAHEVDPLARLIDAGSGPEGITPESTAWYAAIRSMKARGIPIDGVGLEMHVSLAEHLRAEDVAANMKRFNDLGLTTWISEMDLRIQDGQGSEEERLAQQAEIYGQMLSVCLGADACEGFLTWGLTDRYSWILWSWWGGPDAPLVFDEAGNPKRAYDALIRALSAAQT